MNSKTLSIYAAIMAVALVAGIASTTVGTVYADPQMDEQKLVKGPKGQSGETEIKTHLENEDCEEAFCVNLDINFANSPIKVGIIP